VYPAVLLMKHISADINLLSSIDGNPNFFQGVTK
jgi:hypothetical protein